MVPWWWWRMFTQGSHQERELVQNRWSATYSPLDRKTGLNQFIIRCPGDTRCGQSIGPCQAMGDEPGKLNLIKARCGWQWPGNHYYSGAVLFSATVLQQTILFITIGQTWGHGLACNTNNKRRTQRQEDRPELALFPMQPLPETRDPNNILRSTKVTSKVIWLCFVLFIFCLFCCTVIKHTCAQFAGKLFDSVAYVHN